MRSCPSRCAIRFASPAATMGEGCAPRPSSWSSATIAFRAWWASARAIRTDSTERPRRPWPSSSRCSWPRSGRPSRRSRASSAPITRWSGRSAATAPPSARSTSPSTTSWRRSRTFRSTCCGPYRPSCRRPTSRSASTRRRSSPNGRAGRRISRRSRSSAAGQRISRPCVPSGPSSAVPSASTPTRAGPAATRRPSCPSWSSSASS
jgi:hypothetical protein